MVFSLLLGPLEVRTTVWKRRMILLIYITLFTSSQIFLTWTTCNHGDNMQGIKSIMAITLHHGCHWPFYVFEQSSWLWGLNDQLTTLTHQLEKLSWFMLFLNFVYCAHLWFSMQILRHAKMLVVVCVLCTLWCSSWKNLNSTLVAGIIMHFFSHLLSLILVATI